MQQFLFDNAIWIVLVGVPVMIAINVRERQRIRAATAPRDLRFRDPDTAQARIEEAMRSQRLATPEWVVKDDGKREAVFYPMTRLANPFQIRVSITPRGGASLRLASEGLVRPAWGVAVPHGTDQYRAATERAAGERSRAASDLRGATPSVGHLLTTQLPHYMTHIFFGIIGLGLVFTEPSLGTFVLGMAILVATGVFARRRHHALRAEAADRDRRAREALRDD